MMTINPTVTYEEFDGHANPGNPLISDCERYKIERDGIWGYNTYVLITRDGQFHWSPLSTHPNLPGAKADIENHANYGDRP